MRGPPDEGRWRVLFDASPDPAFVTDDFGHIRDANDEACATLGIAGRWLLGKPLSLYVTVEHRRAFRRMLFLSQRVLPVALRGRREAVEVELHLEPLGPSLLSWFARRSDPLDDEL